MGECDVSADVNAFRAINGVTVGATSLNASVGSLTIFNSLQNLFTGEPATDPHTQPTLASFYSALFAANIGALGFASAPQAFNVELPVLRLNRDVGDTTPGASFFSINSAFDTLNRVLSPEQHALLGCGPFYGAPSFPVDCDVYGISVLLTEVGSWFESWSDFYDLGSDWSLLDPTVPQPGTVFFDGPPVCTRLIGDSQATRLPGCRGPGESGYDPAVDGTTTVAGGGQSDLVTPFFDPASPFYQGVDGATPCQSPSQEFNGCQLFRSESAALSFNVVMTFVGFSSSTLVTATDPSVVLDPDDPFAGDRCSFAKPQLCLGTQLLLTHLARELDDDPSGPPQRRWVWETGAEHLQTDEATGGLEDFASWTFHALGPEVSRRDSSDEAGVLFVLGPPDDPGAAPDSPLVVRGSGADNILGTADDPFVGLVYGVVPEPSQVLLYVAALLAAVGVARCRQRGPDSPTT
jgi:hypothetical protein